MKNKILVFFVVASVIVFGASYAEAENMQGNNAQAKTQTQAEVQTQSENNGGELQVQIQSQNQIQNENQNDTSSNATGSQMMQVREENQLQNSNEIKGESKSESSSTKPNNGTSSNQGGKEVDQVEPIQMAEQVRSDVANAVQAMLQIADRNGGVGAEIKLVAQAQNDNQIKIEDSIKKIDSRNGLAKFFIGPDYAEINNAQSVLEQNKAQVSQLNQIKAQITNQSDQQNLATQISNIEQANAKIETSLNQSGNSFSLFGWLFKMFNK
jgi:hypothetical protein